ncbi:MAG: aminotransferase class V-fold PLP-dependent enzyme [Gammaproteobacteria bacterium]|nr:aminotransferase class V-fold PLP-dependent enzyme [Gammaproteobacteria bacterium]
MLNDNITYLNHAAVSPWPQRTNRAVTDFAQENLTQGALHYPQWMQTESNLRHQLAKLINAPSCDDVALLKNTSEALSMVAYGLHWQAGDNVVITNQEFPSNRIVWESLKPKGVEVRYADINAADNQAPENAISRLCDARTRLVSVSSVQYATGLRLNLEQIGAHCKKNNILFCVDAIQSVGALNFDVQQVQADFAMADGHKWMLGPEGLAFFYCEAGLRDRIKLTQFGWRMTEDYLNFDQHDWQRAATARCFECGSPNMMGIHALDASVSLLLEAGMGNIESRINENTQLMMDYIQNDNNLQLVSSPNASRLSGIVSFRHTKLNSGDLHKQLMQENIVCAERGDAVRLSPHFYTPHAKIINAFEVISDL